jgi:hypothetical protein
VRNSKSNTAAGTMNNRPSALRLFCSFWNIGTDCERTQESRSPAGEPAE